MVSARRSRGGGARDVINSKEIATLTDFPVGYYSCSEWVLMNLSKKEYVQSKVVDLLDANDARYALVAGIHHCIGPFSFFF